MKLESLIAYQLLDPPLEQKVGVVWDIIDVFCQI